jgi:hypothetical protein
MSAVAYNCSVDTTSQPSSSHALQQTTASGITVTDEGLIASFVSAMTNFTTLEVAKHTAKQSAADTSRSMAAITAQNNLYVTPDDMSNEQRDQLARASFDAHLQQLQSEQLASKISGEIARLDADIQRLYLGKKMVLQIIDPTFDPVESYWFDPATGQYSQGSITAKQVKGVIHELSLYKNLIVLKPSLYSRIVFPKRKFYFVYVVNPRTLLPAVKIITKG